MLRLIDQGNIQEIANIPENNPSDHMSSCSGICQDSALLICNYRKGCQCIQLPRPMMGSCDFTVSSVQICDLGGSMAIYGHGHLLELSMAIKDGLLTTEDSEIIMVNIKNVT